MTVCGTNSVLYLVYFLYSMLVPVDPTRYLREKIRCIFSQARIQTLFNSAAVPVSWLVRLDSTGCNVQKDPTVCFCRDVPWDPLVRVANQRLRNNYTYVSMAYFPTYHVGSTCKGQTRYLTDVFPTGSTDMLIEDLKNKTEIFICPIGRGRHQTTKCTFDKDRREIIQPNISQRNPYSTKRVPQ